MFEKASVPEGLVCNGPVRAGVLGVRQRAVAASRNPEPVVGPAVGAHT